MQIVKLQPQLAALMLAKICPVVSLSERPKDKERFLVYATKHVFNRKETPVEWMMEAENNMVYGNIPTLDKLPQGAIVGFIESLGDSLSEPSIWTKGLDGELCRVCHTRFFDRPIFIPEFALPNLWLGDIENDLPNHFLMDENHPYLWKNVFEVPVNPALFEQLSSLGSLTLNLHGELQQLVLDENGELRDIDLLQLSCDNREKYVKFCGEIITDLNTQDEFELYPSVTDPSGLTIRRRLRLYL